MSENTPSAAEVSGRDDLMSDHPGIVDDTSDGDLGADPNDAVYGSLAESEAADATPADGAFLEGEGGADRVL